MSNKIKFYIMDIQEDIKILLLKNRMTMKKLAEEMTLKGGKKMLTSSLSQKLSKGTLRFSELKLICEILSYTIEYKKI